MDSGASQDRLRQLAVAGLMKRGAHAGEVDSLIEIILLCDGHYVGRRFECGAWEAVWLAGEETICLYCQGELVETLPLDEPDHRRKAA